MQTIHVPAGTTAPQEAEELAYKESVTQDPAAMTRFLLETVGPRVAAASLGLADARQLRRWSTGSSQPRELVQGDRLRTLFRVVHEISAVFGPATAATFMRSSNPQLDDSAPLLVLRSGEDEQEALEAQRKVISAARAFLEG